MMSRVAAFVTGGTVNRPGSANNSASFNSADTLVLASGLREFARHSAMFEADIVAVQSDGPTFGVATVFGRRQTRANLWSAALITAAGQAFASWPQSTKKFVFNPASVLAHDLGIKASPQSRLDSYLSSSVSGLASHAE